MKRPLSIEIPEYRGDEKRCKISDDALNSVASNTSPMEEDARDPSINPSSHVFMEVDGQHDTAHQWANKPVCTTVSTFLAGDTLIMNGLFGVP